MTIEEGLYAYLQTVSAVTALVGTRVHPEIALETATTFPLVVYQRTDSESLRHTQGSSGLVEVNFELTFWAETYAAAKAGATALKAALDGKVAATFGTVAVGVCNAEHSDDDIELGIGADLQRRYGAKIEVMLTHDE